MNPNINRGAKLGGLMVYLLGPGKANEHTDRHVVAGSASVMRAAWLGRFDGPESNRAARDVALEIAREMDLPRKLHGTRARMRARAASANTGAVEVIERPEKGEKGVLRDAPVWHCSLALRAEEGDLSDETWKAIAEDFMKEMGFVDPTQAGVRWVAVRHGRAGADRSGGDHIHIAASLIREDGSVVDTFMRDPVTGRPMGDYARSQKVVNLLEHRYGLEVLASREDGGALRGNSRAETERRDRSGGDLTERERLRLEVRALASASATEAEFVRRVRDAGISLRPRYSKGGEEVTGYAVRWRSPADIAADRKTEAARLARGGKPLTLEELTHTGPWCSGGLLSKDLALPALRDQWDDSPEARTEALKTWKAGRRSGGQRGREAQTLDDPKLWTRAHQDLQRWNDYLASIPPENHGEWARAAGRAAGVFAAWSRRVESKPGVFAAAATELTRSAQVPAHLRWRPPAAGQRPPGLGAVAVILIQLAKYADRHDPATETVRLVEQLMRTLVAIADAHTARQEFLRAQQLRDRALEPLHVLRERQHQHAQHESRTSGMSRQERIDQQAEQMRAAGVDEEYIRAWRTTARAFDTDPGSAVTGSAAETTRPNTTPDISQNRDTGRGR
ncbi:relaxase/mobilization nuclease domain-containing protein [Nocardia sp. SC052]|uniref:relaxase/mobilization nuclease domain-containing protein n=1 Tax=Nocardia sichangensis TaxID=3385975 RepID=UPI0039A3CC46